MTPLQNTATFVDVNKRLAEKIFGAGAELSCYVCGHKAFKSPEEMAVYLAKWPYCSGQKNFPHKRVPAEVRLL